MTRNGRQSRSPTPFEYAETIGDLRQRLELRRRGRVVPQGTRLRARLQARQVRLGRGPARPSPASRSVSARPRSSSTAAPCRRSRVKDIDAARAHLESLGHDVRRRHLRDRRTWSSSRRSTTPTGTRGCSRSSSTCDERGALVELEPYSFVLLRRPADAPDYPDEQLDELQEQHLAHLASLHERGRAGPGGAVRRPHRRVAARPLRLPPQPGGDARGDGAGSLGARRAHDSRRDVVVDRAG